jgi:dihydrofolate reductase
VRSLTNAGLVDEYQIIIHFVIVNEGRRLFENLKGRTDLQLVGVDTFARGAMLVTYRGASKATAATLLAQDQTESKESL